MAARIAAPADDEIAAVFTPFQLAAELVNPV
jgi:hypothetical protein